MTNATKTGVTVGTYIAVHDAAAAIDFYTNAFGAEEQYRIPMENNRVGHAEIRIGETTLMLSDEAPEYEAISPKTLGGSPVSFVLDTPDLDVTWERAKAAGAVESRPISDAPYGRGGWLKDPFGIRWNIMTSNRDFDPSSMQ